MKPDSMIVEPEHIAQAVQVVGEQGVPGALRALRRQEPALAAFLEDRLAGLAGRLVLSGAPRKVVNGAHAEVMLLALAAWRRCGAAITNCGRTRPLGSDCLRRATGHGRAAASGPGPTPTRTSPSERQACGGAWARREGVDPGLGAYDFVEVPAARRCTPPYRLELPASSGER